ncbi:putative Zinc finger, RING/FYVE/PHD-type [Plasmopara halstedii]
MQSHAKTAGVAQLNDRLSAYTNIMYSKLCVPYDTLRSPKRNLRVNKWDAHKLDSEILNLLKTPLISMLNVLEPGSSDRIKLELGAILKFMLIIFTTSIRRPTPGMRLENVRYVRSVLSSRRVIALILLSVALPYAWERAFRYLLSAHRTTIRNVTFCGARSRNLMLAAMKYFETFVMTCQFANLLVFLRNGTYRSLPERLLGFEMETIKSSTIPRSINIECMTQKLVWDEMMVGNFVLPLLTSNGCCSSADLCKSSSNIDVQASKCCLCGISPPQTPYFTSCKHIYCYYCLQTAVTKDNDFNCVACGNRFNSSERLAN